MSDKPGDAPRGAPDQRPEAQQNEDRGKIKRPQRTDATMAEKDLARGSEPATHNRR